ncbi:MAG: hypothetical protein H6563_04645 [Lewinellaceae bacterium]|nr:hypothetical protein [Lewinellaceae bacterium]
MKGKERSKNYFFNRIKQLLFPLLFSLIFLPALPAQIYLQLERSGSAKTTKFAPGTELTFRLKGQTEWERAVLDRLIPEENRLLLGINYIDPSEIEAIRSFHWQRWSKPMGTNLYLFGASWTGFALGAWVADRNDPYSAGDAIVTLSAIGTGFLIQKLFHHRTWTMGKKWRLRIVDLRVK